MKSELIPLLKFTKFLCAECLLKLQRVGPDGIKKIDPYLCQVCMEKVLAFEKSLEKPKRQPDIDICSECHEHAEFEDDGDGMKSNCCGAGAYDSDPDIDMER